MTLLLAFIVSPLFDLDLAVLDFAVAGLVLRVFPFCFLAIFSHSPSKQIHGGVTRINLFFQTPYLPPNKKSPYGRLYDEEMQAPSTGSFSTSLVPRTKFNEFRAGHMSK
jgi:hypothetical protein